MNRRSERNGFTALRLLCALFVLFTHSYALLGLRDEPLFRLTGLVAFGSVGVDGFFAISGFLVCVSLLRAPSSLAYMRNRLLRLLPGLIVLVAVLVLILGPVMTAAPDYWRDKATWRYLATATVYGFQQHLPGVFAQNPTDVVAGSLWTLPMELTCYFVLLAMERCRVLSVWGLGIVTVVALAIHLGGVVPEHTLLLRMDLARLDRFAVLFFGGGVLAVLGDRVRFSLAGAGCVLLVIAAAAIPQREGLFDLVYLSVLPYLLVSLAGSMTWAAGLNDWDASYGVYLYGYPVQQSLIAVLGTAIGTTYLTVMAAPAALVLGLLSWRLVERPALAFKQP